MRDLGIDEVRAGGPVADDADDRLGDVTAEDRGYAAPDDDLGTEGTDDGGPLDDEPAATGTVAAKDPGAAVRKARIKAATKAFFAVEPYPGLCRRVAEHLPAKSRSKTIQCAALMYRNPGPLGREQMGVMVLGKGEKPHDLRNWPYQGLANLMEDKDQIVAHKNRRPETFELDPVLRALIDGADATPADGGDVRADAGGAEPDDGRVAASRGDRDLFADVPRPASGGDLVGVPVPVSQGGPRAGFGPLGGVRVRFFGHDIRERDMAHAIDARHDGVVNGFAKRFDLRNKHEVSAHAQPWMNAIFVEAFDAAVAGEVGPAEHEELLRFQERYPDEVLALPTRPQTDQEYLSLHRVGAHQPARPSMPEPPVPPRVPDASPADRDRGPERVPHDHVSTPAFFPRNGGTGPGPGRVTLGHLPVRRPEAVPVAVPRSPSDAEVLPFPDRVIERVPAGERLIPAARPAAPAPPVAEELPADVVAAPGPVEVPGPVTVAAPSTEPAPVAVPEHRTAPEPSADAARVAASPETDPMAGEPFGIPDVSAFAGDSVDYEAVTDSIIAGIARLIEEQRAIEAAAEAARRRQDFVTKAAPMIQAAARANVSPERMRELYALHGLELSVPRGN